jgi:hypothetical protein
VLIAGVACITPARAQSLEPRAYANAPVGVNFAVAGYLHSEGGVALDPAVPLDDADARVDATYVGYVRSLGVAGKSAKLQAILTHAWFSGEATLVSTGDLRTRDVSGFGDPIVRFSVNLMGAPALTMQEFKGYRQDVIVGVTLQVSAPLGQYDSDRLINIGTNRWSFKPEIGVSKALGRFTLEGAGAVTFYTDNDDFFGGQHREQDPISSVQGHVIYTFRRDAWVAFDATYYGGGRSTVNGETLGDLQSNTRYGLSLSVPVSNAHSIKLFASDGVYTRVGEDFFAAGIAWQYRWI